MTRDQPERDEREARWGDRRPHEAPLGPLVFLCHSSSDKKYVRRLDRRLRGDKIRTWLDERELLPGQEWDPAIRQAVRAADVVVVCLSSASIDRSGYIQKEIRHVLDVADEQPGGVIFVIPAKIEDCQVPDRLARWQWVDMRKPGGYNRLVAAIRAAERADRERAQRGQAEPVERADRERAQRGQAEPVERADRERALRERPERQKGQDSIRRGRGRATKGGNRSDGYKITPETSCRFCAAPVHHVFVDLGLTPIANYNVPIEQASATEVYMPLCALTCSRCFLVQLAPFQTPTSIFLEDYAYFSSFSTSWLEHCRRYTEDMIERLGLDGSSQVIELASNDGYLLQYFQRAGVPVLGIEPTASTAQVAIDKGIPTRVEFWGVATARAVAAETQADLLLGNNVLAYVPDINDFVAGMKLALAGGGTITIEFPHLLKLIELNQWDTIYHEHSSYLSFGTVARVFEAHGLRLYDVQELPTHGGSLRIFGCHADDERPQSRAVRDLLERERAAGLEDIQTYLDYGERVIADKRQVVSLLHDLKAAGNAIAGYGAPAKGNTLLNYCGIGRDVIDFTCDANPHKQGHMLPGTHIPILAPEAINEHRPDVVLILPWNIKDEIMGQLGHIREWGGRFAARSPELRIFE